MKNIALCLSAAVAALATTFLLDQPAPAATSLPVAAAVPAEVSSATPEPTRAAREIATPVDTAMPAAELAPLPARRWDLGLERVYRVSATRRLRFERAAASGGAGDAAPAPVHTGLAGELALVVKEADDEVVHVEATLRHATQQTGDGAREAASELESPFLVTYERTGHVTAAHFAPGTSADARNQLQALVASMQLVVPNPRAVEWSTEERDVSGEYDAKWTRTGDRAAQRQKLRYRRVVTVDGLVPTADVGRYDVSSSDTFTLDAAGWPTALTAIESLRAGNATDPMTITMDGKTTATLLRSEDASQAGGPVDWDRYETRELALAPSFDGARRSIDAQRVGRDSLGDMVSQLAAIPDRADPRSRALAQQHARLASLFRLKPEAAADAMARIARGEVDAISSRSLIGALGTAGTPEAQRALTGALADSSMAREHRLGATVALGLTPTPNAETVEGLMAASTSEDADLAHASTLAAGSAIHRARKEGTADVKDAVQELITRLGSAASPDEAAIILDALGNSGDPRAFPAIRPYLEIGHAGLRATATSALRFIAAPEVDPILDAVLASDFEPEVRGAALVAINLRDVSAHLPALLRAVRSEAVEPLRSAILAALLPYAAEAQVNAALKEVAANDVSASLRETAAAAL